MNQKVVQFKIDLIEALISSGMHKRVSSSQHRIKYCPKCGDMKYHMYIKIDVNNDEPVVFRCVKCTSAGVVDNSFLEYLEQFGMKRLTVPKWSKYRKLNVQETASSKSIDTNTVNDSDDVSNVCEYINSRVGHYPSLTELQFFGYVGKPIKYVRDYLGDKNMNMLNNRYWFRMTNGNIVGRWYDDNTDSRWLKYRSPKVGGAGLYKINIPIDLYQPINVIIAEGVMDVIGLYYNYKGCVNNVYIAVLGKDYESGIRHVLSRGIFGENVIVKIFKDGDVGFIRIDNNLKKLFKRIDIYENAMRHDYGVTEDELDIQRVIKIGG